MTLSDKRKKIEKKLVVLIPKLGCGIVNSIIQQIKDQDKEFIRLIEEINKNEWNPKVAMNNINKLAGMN